MKNKFKDFFTSKLFKKLLLAGAVTAGATAAATVAVKTVKKRRGMPLSGGKGTLPHAKNVYITGNSIAALAAAAYLIKDGGYDGSSIHIYGSPAHSALNEEYGSVGEVFTSLMRDIDAVTDEGVSICDIIENSAFTPEPTVKIMDGSGNIRVLDISPSRTVLKAVNKALKSFEAGKLDEISIREYFAGMSEIFDTDLFSFIEMSFGIRDEHKASEFAKRAEQVLVISPQTGFYDTLYYEFSAKDALEQYLTENGADYHANAEVTGIEIVDDSVNAIHLNDNGTRMTIYLNKDDCLMFTAGNISDNRSEGSASTSAPLIEEIPPSLSLWSQAALNSDNFGIPELILADCPDSMELSIVDENNYLTKRICELTSSDAEEGISLLLTGSNWRMKLSAEGLSSLYGSNEDLDKAINDAAEVSDGADVSDLTDEDIAAAEYIAAQTVTGCITVKGMYCGSYDNFVDKPMRECTGTELLYELCCHLGIIDEWEEILRNIKLMMVVNYPYKTAPLATMQKHTTPELHPCSNCYCIGGFMETSAPACTLEQEVLSAKLAAYSLIGVKNI